MSKRADDDLRDRITKAVMDAMGCVPGFAGLVPASQWGTQWLS
jgi:hypothetical protein